MPGGRVVGRVGAMHRTHLIPVLAAAASLAVPAVAAADSIVYLDQSAVWAAEPDGSQKVQLTPNSSYHAVAQADDGTIVAARTGGFDVLARDGSVIRGVDTKPHRAANASWHDNTPSDLDVSPDGKTVAYEYYDIGCPPEGGPCLPEHTVLYTSTQGPVATDPQVHGVQYNRESPQFVTNDRVLLSGGSGAWASLDTLGGGDSSSEGWLTDTGQITHGSLSPDGTRFAGVFSYGPDATLGLIAVKGDPRTGVPARPAPEDAVCTTEPDEKLGFSSWAPDGSGIAYESAKGIEVVRFSSFARGDCGVSGSSVLAATGSEPDWGPAAPTAAPVAGPGGETQPGIGPVGGPGTGPVGGGGGAAAKPALGKVKATRSALRKGLRVAVTLPAAGRTTVKLAAGKRTVAKTTKTLQAGRSTVRLPKLGRKASRRLQGKALTLTVSGPGGSAKQALRVR